MISNYHTFACVASSLNSKLAGSAIESAFSQEKDELAITFDGPFHTLLISCSQLIHTLFLHPRFSRAKSNTVNLLNACWRQSIRLVEVHPADRIINLVLSSGQQLQAHMYGSRPNVLLVGEENLVLDDFRNAKTLIGSRIKAFEGELVYDAVKLSAAIANRSKAKIDSLLKQEYPTLGSAIVKEILFRASVPPVTMAFQLSENEMAALVSAFVSVVGELGHPLFRVYVDRETGRPMQFSLIAMRQLGDQQFKEFSDIHEAIHFFLSRRSGLDALDEKKRAITEKVRLRLSRLHRSMAASESDLSGSSRSEEYRRYGALLMAHFAEVPHGATEARLQDDGVEVVIPLQPALTSIANAQLYFEKAKRAQTTRQESRQRLDGLHKMAESGERLLGSIGGASNQADLNKTMTEFADEMKDFGVDAESKKREELPFRVFFVDGGFEVWVGKSSNNNDLLTMKYAKPRDLWFHARGGSGSHVILRITGGKSEPSKKAKEQAAAIAAYYSKMKGSKLAPVAMTERKYVRKPKGAPAGTVVIEREKVIFVGPRLPDPEK
jgi:predicted ribosome quality control (RQC) complex YloA/Tae2 family protein